MISLASPTLIKQIPDDTQHSLDIILSLDTSGSMSLNGFNEFDYNQSRWSVVQDVASDFIKKRTKDRIAMVIFGDTSAIVSPLSYDNTSPLSTLQNISIGLVGRSTALIDSLATATSLLQYSLNSSKLIILLSDGDDTASKLPLEIVLTLLQKHHIKVYTIAIGESNNNLLLSSFSFTINFSPSFIPLLTSFKKADTKLSFFSSNFKNNQCKYSDYRY